MVGVVGIVVDGTVAVVVVVVAVVAVVEDDWGAGAGGAMEFNVLFLTITTAAAAAAFPFGGGGGVNEYVVPGRMVDGNCCCCCCFTLLFRCGDACNDDGCDNCDTYDETSGLVIKFMCALDDIAFPVVHCGDMNLLCDGDTDDAIVGVVVLEVKAATAVFFIAFVLLEGILVARDGSFPTPPPPPLLLLDDIDVAVVRIFDAVGLDSLAVVGDCLGIIPTPRPTSIERLAPVPPPPIG